MTSRGELAAAEPELAALVRRAFEVRKHAVLATLRRDWSPRLSGSEVEFDDATGELVIGSMPGSRKTADLLRNPRLALHCPTEDPPPDDASAWLGDGKVAGRALPTGDGVRWRVELTEVVHTRVVGDALVVLAWHPGAEVERHERS